MRVISSSKSFKFSRRLPLLLASRYIKGYNYYYLRLTTLGSILVILYPQLPEVEAVLVFISGIELACFAPLGYITTYFLANSKVDALGAPYIV